MLRWPLRQTTDTRGAFYEPAISPFACHRLVGLSLVGCQQTQSCVGGNSFGLTFALQPMNVDPNRLTEGLAWGGVLLSCGMNLKEGKQ